LNNDTKSYYFLVSLFSIQFLPLSKSFSFMRSSILLAILVLLSADLSGQYDLPAFQLESGKIYYLKIQMNQETQTENNVMLGNVSLEIRCNLKMQVTAINSANNYSIKGVFSKLMLSFLSPASGQIISSETSAFGPLRVYLDSLLSHSFRIEMSRHGEIVNISGLDSVIMDFYNNERYNPQQHDLIIKTIKEAFGEQALQSMLNIALNVYNDSNAIKTEKSYEIAFNAREVRIQNKLYYSQDSNGDNRIQGIGLIEKDVEVFDLENISISTSLKGTQTYDYLFDKNNGWIKEGVSRQKIQSLSTIEGHEELPDGLKIPSYTETEFNFNGGLLEPKK